MALAKKLSDFSSALSRLEEAYAKTIQYKNDADYTFFRDSTIQRFEFTLEIGWKTVKTFLLEYDGIICRSPKACMRDFFTSGYVKQLEIEELLLMIDDRNLVTHTYHEALADTIFANIGGYIEVLNTIYNAIQSRHL